MLVELHVMQTLSLLVEGSQAITSRPIEYKLSLLVKNTTQCSCELDVQWYSFPLGSRVDVISAANAFFHIVAATDNRIMT